MQQHIFSFILPVTQGYELENHQNAGKTLDDAFTTVFRKEKPGRVRCYGRSVTRTSLQKDEEMNELKQKHANEVTSMKEENILGSDGSNIPSPDASNAQAIRGKILSNSSGSAHASVHEKNLCGGSNLNGGCHNLA
ncbi:hypothetical protein P3S68_001260 [Capsicum galapagoense]